MTPRVDFSKEYTLNMLRDELENMPLNTGQEKDRFLEAQDKYLAYKERVYVDFLRRSGYKVIIPENRRNKGILQKKNIAYAVPIVMVLLIAGMTLLACVLIDYLRV